MGKLYIIGVGGSGSRVLQSLLMLLASGQKINASEIVPMIIDTDANNGNLNDFKSVARLYSEINDTIAKDNNEEVDGHFFHTKVRNSVDITVDGRQFRNLKELINYNGIRSSSSKKLIDLLFSEDNLQMPLEKGFVGNPNIGSVVLNYIIHHSDQFLEFTQQFAEGDRIFIVSSIFGGTGAAGFPLLLNNFRKNDEMERTKLLNEAIIGAVTVLPYFAVAKKEETPDKSLENYDVDSNTFIMKTKAALNYYAQYVSDSIDALYFIGDYKRSTFKNQKGGINQNNPASFIELAAAMSAIDFMDYYPEKTKRGDLPHPNNFGEFSLDKDADEINFEVLDDEDAFSGPLVRQHLFRLFFRDHLKESLETRKLRWKTELDMDANFLKSNSGLAKSLTRFYEFYDQWLEGMQYESHARVFKPFLTGDTSRKNLLGLFNGKKPKMKKTLFSGESIPTVDLDKFLNEAEVKKNGTKDQRFMDLMNRGFQNIYNHYFLQ